MILINQERLLPDALKNEDDKLHAFAKLYDSTLNELKKKFGKTVHFIRPDRPRKTKGATARGKEVPGMSIPVEPIVIPLSATVVLDEIPMGSNTWTCSMRAPRPIDGGLWEPGGRRSLIIKSAELSVSIENDPDLAVFMYKICPFVKKGILKLKDAQAEAEALAKREHLITERKMAVWKVLPADKVPTMARAYGLNNVDGKSEAILRAELERQLEINDSLKLRNPAVKGTLDFIEEMKINDNVLIRAFVRRMQDEKRLTLAFDKFKIGDKVVYHVPAMEIKRANDALCQYLNASNNTEKLAEFIRDLIYKEYLAGITDKKELQWLARIAGINPEFKKLDDLKVQVANVFCPA
jgi:hypothetical protein